MDGKTFEAPVILPEMRPFWQAAAEGRFVLPRCRVCGTWYWPHSGCRNHENEAWLANMTFEPASGRGTVYAFTVPRMSFKPAFPAPFVYAAIELEEGPVMPNNVVDCDVESVHVGMKVQVTFVTMDDGTVVPKFRPA